MNCFRLIPSREATCGKHTAVKGKSLEQKTAFQCSKSASPLNRSGTNCHANAVSLASLSKHMKLTRNYSNVSSRVDSGLRTRTEDGSVSPLKEKQGRRRGQLHAKRLIEGFFVKLDACLNKNRELPRKLIEKAQRIRGLIVIYRGMASEAYLGVLDQMLYIVDKLLRDENVDYSVDSHVRYLVNCIASHRTVPSLDYTQHSAIAVQQATQQLNATLRQLTAKKLLVKSMQQLKGFRFPSRDTLLLIQSFLCLFCQVDKTIDVTPGFSLMKSRLWSVFNKYLANPGNAIQTLRKFPHFIVTKRISFKNVQASRELFRKINSETIPCIHRYLDTAFQFYDTYTLYKSQQANSIPLKYKSPIYYQGPRECKKTHSPTLRKYVLRSYQSGKGGPRFLGAESWRELGDNDKTSVD